MNLQMGSQSFIDVQIPLLWGNRAIVQDQEGHLSIINLEYGCAKLEILGDEPADGIVSMPSENGFKVVENGKILYEYNRDEKKLNSIELALPGCQISSTQIQIGSNKFSNKVISGHRVGIKVDEKSITMGAQQLPSVLAKLVV